VPAGAERVIVAITSLPSRAQRTSSYDSQEGPSILQIG
jgi:hypothetical protein